MFIRIFVKNSLWFYYGLKTMTASLDTNDVLTLGWEIIHQNIYYINHFFMVLYLEQPLIYFSVKFPFGIFLLLYPPPPLIIKLRAALWHIFFSFVKCFIACSKIVDFINACVNLIIIRSGWRLQQWTINYIYYQFYQYLV